MHDAGGSLVNTVLITVIIIIITILLIYFIIFIYYYYYYYKTKNKYIENRAEIERKRKTRNSLVSSVTVVS